MILDPHEHLERMLTRLKLTAIRDQLDNLIDEAGRRDLTIREALTMFCEREIARKGGASVPSEKRSFSQDRALAAHIGETLGIKARLQRAEGLSEKPLVAPGIELFDRELILPARLKKRDLRPHHDLRAVTRVNGQSGRRSAPHRA